MKYKFEIFGRPKNVDSDAIMAKINKTFQELISDTTIKVFHNHSLGVISFESTKEFNDNELDTITRITKSIFEERFTDIQIERILK